jgi:hypothetical protein
MTARASGEPRLASVASWAVLTASFGLSASTWVALAELAGFTSHATIRDVTVRLAWLMPVAVDGYLVVALVLWMSPVPTVITSFARKNTYMAAAIGIVAQSSYHSLLTWSSTGVGWRAVLAALVGSLPPAFAGLAVHMRALIRRESDTCTPPAPQPQHAAAEPTDPIPTTIPAPSAPNPAQVADRITVRPPTTDRPVPAGVSGRSARPARLDPPIRTTSPAALDAPSTDSSVTAQAATQPASATVAPDLLDRARTVTRQYRTEHATPITTGQLAVRLKVTTDLAAQLLALADPEPSGSAPARTVNGHTVKATR